MHLKSVKDLQTHNLQIINKSFRPFIAFLHGKTLEELGRAYLPENIKIPVGFHGLWVPYEN